MSINACAACNAVCKRVASKSQPAPEASRCAARRRFTRLSPSSIVCARESVSSADSNPRLSLVPAKFSISSSSSGFGFKRGLCLFAVLGFDFQKGCLEGWVEGDDARDGLPKRKRLRRSAAGQSLRCRMKFGHPRPYREAGGPRSNLREPPTALAALSQETGCRRRAPMRMSSTMILRVKPDIAGMLSSLNRSTHEMHRPFRASHHQ